MENGTCICSRWAGLRPDEIGSIDVVGGAGEHVVRLAGEFDVSNVATLRSELEAVDERGPARVTIDLDLVHLMDSKSLGALVAAARRAERGGYAFEVRHPRANVRKIIDLLELAEPLHLG